MRIISIIQARLSSTRLPNKVLLNLAGKKVLEHVVNRSNACRSITDTIIATTVNKKDLKIVEFCAKKGISVYCGSEDDVLDRYYQTARLFGADHVVRITSDCPVIDPKIVDKVISLHLKEKADLTANILTETFPDGLDVEVFTYKALEKAWNEANLKSQREHVTPYIKDNPNIFKLVNMENNENLYSKRWTLDNKEDYVFLTAVYKKLYKKKPLFEMNDILKLLKQYPGLEKINSSITRNEGYQKSLKEDKVVKIK